MSDFFFTLVSDYGVWLVLASACLSCLFVPIPTAFVMLAGGAFAASEDLVLWQVLAAGYAGAVLGDQTGFQIGRRGGAAITRMTQTRPRAAALLNRARATVARWGGPGVFFSTWLFAPLGPYVNVVAGAAGLGWWRYTLWDIAGEAVWVGAYVMLGFTFAGQIATLATVLGNSAGLLAALAVTIGLGLALRDALRKSRAREAERAAERTAGTRPAGL